MKGDVLGKCRKNKNVDEFWEVWSNAVEIGWLNFLGHKGATKKALLGNGGG